MTSRQSKITILLEPELEHMFQEYLHLQDKDIPLNQHEILGRILLGDEIYGRRVSMPKWNVQVDMLSEPKVAIRHALDWGIPTSKSVHAQKAAFFDDMAQKLDREWNNTVDLAINAYGKQGSLISGVYRDHFPPEVKNRLRFLAHGKTMARDAAHLHEYLSKTRSPLFR
jgi:hypothetical protein